MSRPVILYCFGSIGGPFKIGYSKNPDMRFSQIRCTQPGCSHIRGYAIQWLSIVYGTEDEAKEAEKIAHSDLNSFRLSGKKRRGIPVEPEWFNAPLSRIAQTFEMLAQPRREEQED